MKKNIFILLLLLIPFISGIEIFDVTFPNGTVLPGYNASSPRLDRYRVDFEPFYAAVVFPGTPRAAQQSFTFRINGQDVLIDKFVTFSNIVETDYQIDQLVIELAQTGNYDGIMLMEMIPPTFPAGYMNNFFNNLNHDAVEVPVVNIGFFEGIHMITGLSVNGSTPVVVRISPDDPNAWKEMYHSKWFRFFQMTIFPLCVLNVFLAVQKIVHTIDRDTCRFNAAQITLFALAFANLWRSIVFYVDPVFSQGVLGWEMGTFVMTLHFPFEQVTVLLLAFYWATLIDDSDLVIKTFLGYLSIPFGIVAGLLFTQELVGSLIRGLIPGAGVSTLIIVSAFLYLLFNVGICIFFFFNGVKVLNLTQSIETAYYKRLRRVTYKILAAGVMLILWIIPLAVSSLFPFTFFTPYGNSITWYFLMLILIITSSLSINAITLPPKENSKFLSKGTNKSN